MSACMRACVYCWSKHLCLHMLTWVSVRACKGLCVLAQANLSKQVFVIASGWMTFEVSLDSPVTSCVADRGQEQKELTEEAEKPLAR